MAGSALKPRMCVHKSNKSIYVQIIDDEEGKTICGLSTKKTEIKDAKDITTRKNSKFAEILGDNIAKIALEKGIKEVVFDRSGYRYHGVVKVIADAARKAGLKF